MQGQSSAVIGSIGPRAAAYPDDDDPASSPDDRLYTTRQLLVFTLRYSRSFPSETAERWIDDLARVDVEAPEAGQTFLAGIRDDYLQAKQKHRPDATMRSPGLGADIVFARETSEIERHLDALDALLAEVTDARHGGSGGN